MNAWLLSAFRREGLKSCLAWWKAGFPKDKVQLSAYGPLFNIQLLESQLVFIHKDNYFYKKSAVEVLNDLKDEFGLQESLPEVAKLLKLNAAIAVSSASVQRSLSCSRSVNQIFAIK